MHYLKYIQQQIALEAVLLGFLLVQMCVWTLTNDLIRFAIGNYRQTFIAFF